MTIFDANFIFSFPYFSVDVSDSISMDCEFNYQYTSFIQRRRIKKAEYIVESFADISSILITCFSHLCELMVCDTYHDCLHYNKRCYFQMIVDSMHVPKRKCFCCYRKSLKNLLKYFLRIIIQSRTLNFQKKLYCVL